jgi:hypothetical protein
MTESYFLYKSFPEEIPFYVVCVPSSPAQKKRSSSVGSRHQQKKDFRRSVLGKMSKRDQDIVFALIKILAEKNKLKDKK